MKGVKNADSSGKEKELKYQVQVSQGFSFFLM